VRLGRLALEAEMNAPIVEDMVEVQCSCGRFHRLPSRIREFRCACHMTIGVNIDPYVSTEFIAALPTPTIQLPPGPAPVPSLPRFDRPVLPKLDRPVQTSMPPKAERDDGWKGDMLDVMERVAALEEQLHAEQQQRAALEAELEKKRQEEAKYLDTLEQVKPILEDWEQLEQENARLCRIMMVARERGRVDVADLLRRAKMLRQLDLLR
jgi:hypothetical protein